MKHKRLLLVGLFVYLLITVWKWDVVWKSTLALVFFMGMVVAEGESLSRHWNAGLADYWLASTVWLAGGFMLVRTLIRKQGVRFLHQNPALRSLALIGFCLLSAHVVAPVSPNVLGDPLHTRLLPPLACGAIIRTAPVASAHESDRSFAAAFKNLEAELLFRIEQLTGDTGAAERSNEAGVTTAKVVFVLGTDDNGRDVLSRVLHGGRVSVLIGLAAALGALGVGTVVGFFAGYGNRMLDTMLMRFTDMMLAIPGLFLVVGMMAFLPSSLFTLVVVLSLTGWMPVARTVRTEVLRLRHQEFVLAARLLNQSWWRIFARHIIPNLKPLLITVATLQFGNAVLAEASLSFLGLGVQPPTPSWGNMLGEALSYLGRGWWLAVFPGCALAAVLIASHTAAERIAGIDG